MLTGSSRGWEHPLTFAPAVTQGRAGTRLATGHPHGPASTPAAVTPRPRGQNEASRLGARPLCVALEPGSSSAPGWAGVCPWETDDTCVQTEATQHGWVDGGLWNLLQRYSRVPTELTTVLLARSCISPPRPVGCRVTNFVFLLPAHVPPSLQKPQGGRGHLCAPLGLLRQRRRGRGARCTPEVSPAAASSAWSWRGEPRTPVLEEFVRGGDRSPAAPHQGVAGAQVGDLLPGKGQHTPALLQTGGPAGGSVGRGHSRAVTAPRPEGAPAPRPVPTLSGRTLCKGTSFLRN